LQREDTSQVERLLSLQRTLEDNFIATSTFENRGRNYVCIGLTKNQHAAKASDFGINHSKNFAKDKLLASSLKSLKQQRNKIQNLACNSSLDSWRF